MIINKIEHSDTAEGQVTITLSKDEVTEICNTICDFSRHINRNMFTQLIITRDILDHGTVSEFALSQCGKNEDMQKIEARE